MTARHRSTSRPRPSRGSRAHRKARVARLTADKGWLSLVDKVWLGGHAKNRIGVGVGDSLGRGPRAGEGRAW